MEFRLAETVRYDMGKGELQTLADDRVREVVQVRARLQEAILRQAVIIELERLGYTVISPEPE